MGDSTSFCIESVAIQMKKLSEANDDEPVIEDVELPVFVDVYEELCKFIGMLGKIFEFVEKDVREKIDLLRELHTANPDGYQSVLKMVAVEKADVLPHKNKESGAIAVLHLNRALEFIVEFMYAAVAATNEDSIAKVCKDCYDGTLAKHHPWLIRTAVKVAVYTLPSREKMLEYIKGKYFCLKIRRKSGSGTFRNVPEPKINLKKTDIYGAARNEKRSAQIFPENVQKAAAHVRKHRKQFSIRK
uniref:GLTP domain-containing protein n=1 Tax=Caenorhabditis japonica TaxID=281687 RepID=A0A8R1DGU0_CAEJA